MASSSENTAGETAGESKDVASPHDEPSQVSATTTDATDDTDCETADEATPNAQVDIEGPPKDAAEARLRSVLDAFYRERKNNKKLGNVPRIARRYSGDGMIGLWAALGMKYSLAPALIAQWLAKALDPHVPVQWPKKSVPQGAQDVLQELVEKGGECEDSYNKCANEILQRTLDKGDDANDVDDGEGGGAAAVGAAASALGFLGCKDAKLRARLWRSLLKLSRAMGQTERRTSYEELRMKVMKQQDEAASNKSETSVESTTATNAAAMRAEIEADARAAWKGDTFLDRPEVMTAIVNIVRTHALQGSGFFCGSCEIAVLLLYVMESGGSVDLADAEADAFWCLSVVMAEVYDAVSADSSLAGQIRRTHVLLQAYDPPLAELLEANGLVALPAQRLGAALCTRAGFTLEACALVWDMLLSDPQRFELSDFVVLALLLLSHGNLMQHDSVGGVAEALLAAPRTVDVNTLLSTIRAICAFERRLRTYPPRAPLSGSDVLDGILPSGAAIDVAVSVAQQKLSSLWGKVRTVSVEAWEAGRTAAQSEVAQSWASAAASAAGQAAAVAAGAADRAAAAAATAATHASAILETKRQAGHASPEKATKKTAEKVVEKETTTETEKATEKAAEKVAEKETTTETEKATEKEVNTEIDKAAASSEITSNDGNPQKDDPPALVAPPPLVEAPPAEDGGPPQLVELKAKVGGAANETSG